MSAVVAETLMPAAGLLTAAAAGAGLLVFELAARRVRASVTDARSSTRTAAVSGFSMENGREYVYFPANGFAAHPGQLSMRAVPGGGLVLLGAPEPIPEAGKLRRAVLAGSAEALRRAKAVRLTGHLGETPEDFGLQWAEAKVPGNYPAWLVPGSPKPDASETWVIHVHGLGSARSQTLRGVSAFSDLGYTSLIPSYSTSLDLGAAARPLSTLGHLEWETVAAAEEFALSHGARRIIYVGWSLGASIALRVIEKTQKPEVVGAVLISPALDWHSIILSALAKARLPRAVGRALIARFNSDRGLPPIDLTTMPGSRDSVLSDLPILLLHGSEDHSVPIELSRELVARKPDKIRLVEFPKAHHTLEWNSDPAGWTGAVQAWCSGISRQWQEANMEGAI